MKIPKAVLGRLGNADGQPDILDMPSRQPRRIPRHPSRKFLDQRIFTVGRTPEFPPAGKCDEGEDVLPRVKHLHRFEPACFRAPEDGDVERGARWISFVATFPQGSDEPHRREGGHGLAEEFVPDLASDFGWECGECTEGRWRGHGEEGRRGRLRDWGIVMVLGCEISATCS